MKWDVIIEDNGRIVPYNVFNNSLFCDAVLSLINHPDNETKDREWFSEQIKSKAQWQFWSRCEYEFIITSWPPCKNKEGHKMDVFEQLCINWDRFMDYIMLWRHNYLIYEKNLPKEDYSYICSKDDDNDAHCWGCKYFNFPTGCIIDKEIEVTNEK